MTTPDTSAEETAEDRAADVAYMVRASQTLPHHLIDVRAGDVVRWLREIAAARALLPSPAAVRQARLVAAEIVAEWIERMPTLPSADARSAANIAASHIRDRADTHSGVHDEGGDVDERELLVLAQRVDRCTTLGELEELIAKWREGA